MTRLGKGKRAMLAAVVAVALLSIPAQAGRTMKVITKGLGANGNISDMSNPADSVFGFVSIQLMSDPTSYIGPAGDWTSSTSSSPATAGA